MPKTLGVTLPSLVQIWMPFRSKKPTQIRSPLLEIALVLVRLDHIASVVVNANHKRRVNGCGASHSRLRFSVAFGPAYHKRPNGRRFAAKLFGL